MRIQGGGCKGRTPPLFLAWLCPVWAPHFMLEHRWHPLCPTYFQVLDLPLHTLDYQQNKTRSLQTSCRVLCFRAYPIVLTAAARLCVSEPLPYCRPAARCNCVFQSLSHGIEQLQGCVFQSLSHSADQLQDCVFQGLSHSVEQLQGCVFQSLSHRPVPSTKQTSGSHYAYANEQPGPLRGTVSTWAGHIWWKRAGFSKLGTGRRARKLGSEVTCLTVRKWRVLQAGSDVALYVVCAQFWLVMKYLSELTQDQTLVCYSGHPLGVFPSHAMAPRMVITNGMVRT